MNFNCLGCKINLFSKSGIRYEGILYAVDTKEPTIALAKVKSHGTEGRPAERSIPPRDEIYEYIIFRGSDIKNLEVSEPAEPPILPSGLPDDPAIIQHSAPISVSYRQPSYSNVSGVQYQHYPNQLTYQHLQPLFSGAGSRSGSSQTSLRKSPTMDAGVQVSGEKDENASKTSLSDAASKSSLNEYSRLDQDGDQKRMQNQYRGSQRGRGSRRGSRGRGRGGYYAKNAEILKFDGEYDFEQANEEFKQLETEMADVKLESKLVDPLAAGDSNIDPADKNTYNKEKSFFDDISCEASRIAKGIPRFDWRIERKLNVETFGVSRSNNSWLRRRRGRGFRRGMMRGRIGQPSSDVTKTVTFGTREIVTVDTNFQAPAEVMKEEIPVIELVEDKEKDWKEGTQEESQDEWQLEKPITV